MKAIIFTIILMTFASLNVSSQEKKNNFPSEKQIRESIGGKKWKPSDAQNTLSRIIFYKDSMYSCLFDSVDSITGAWEISGNKVNILLDYNGRKTNVDFEVVFITNDAMTIVHNGMEYAYIREENKSVITPNK
jgi:hypothetical protein